MKLAEALKQRKDLNTKIIELTQRASQNVLVEKGEDPAEDVQSLLGDIEAFSQELQGLTVKINLTNNLHGIMEMSSKRDMYRNLSRIYRQMAQTRTSRYGRDEISYVPSIDIKAANEKANDYADKASKMDFAIQSLDFSADLVD